MGKQGNAEEECAEGCHVGGVPISEKSTSFEKKDINFCTSSDVNASASALARFSISVFTSSLPMLVCWIGEGVGGNEGDGRRVIERSGKVCLGEPICSFSWLTSCLAYNVACSRC